MPGEPATTFAIWHAPACRYVFITSDFIFMKRFGLKKSDFPHPMRSHCEYITSLFGKIKKAHKTK